MSNNFEYEKLRRTVKKIFIFFLTLTTAFTLIWFIKNITLGRNHGKTVIEYSYWVGTPEEIEANRLIIEAFHLENPDIQVIVRHHPWADYFTKLYTGIITNTAPDVLRMSYAFLPDYVHYNAIEPLDDFIATDSTFNNDELVTWPYEACIVDNYIMSMPIDCPIDIFYYNKNIFKAACLPYPDEYWDWNDLIETGLKLKEYFKSNDMNDIYPLGGLLYSQFVMENGAKIIERDTMICALDTPSAIEAIQFVHSLIHDYKLALAPEAENSIGGDPFLKEKCAMTYGGSYMLQTYNKKATFDWDITYRPKGVKWIAKTSACGLCMTKQCQEKEAAWRLIKFFVGKKAQEIYANIGAFVPIRKDVLNSDSFLPSEYKPKHKHLLLDVEGSISQNWSCRNWGRFRTAIGQEIDLVMEGKLSPVDGCHRAAKRGNQILNEVYSR